MSYHAPLAASSAANLRVGLRVRHLAALVLAVLALLGPGLTMASAQAQSGVAPVSSAVFDSSNPQLDTFTPNAGPAARSMLVPSGGLNHARALLCLTQAIYYEAGGESDAGQRAVAQVVMNRVADQAFPDTVCGVVFQGSMRSTGCQFTFTCDGSLDRKPLPAGWARAARHASDALDGAVYAPVGLATHYHTLEVHPYWSDDMIPVRIIGNHIFYRWSGAAGQPAAFNQQYAGNEPLPMVELQLAYKVPKRIELAANDVRYQAQSQAQTASGQATAPTFDPETDPDAATADADPPAPAWALPLPNDAAIKKQYPSSASWLPQP